MFIVGGNLKLISFDVTIFHPTELVLYCVRYRSYSIFGNILKFDSAPNLVTKMSNLKIDNSQTFRKEFKAMNRIRNNHNSSAYTSFVLVAYF